MHKLSIGGIVVLVVLLNLACESEVVPTPTPAPKVTAVQLYQEREDNASRFDLNYKDKYVTVTGAVENIDGGVVSLHVGGFFTGVSLNDLTQEEQASANKGEAFTATCKVGNFILGTMRLNDCQKIEE